MVLRGRVQNLKKGPKKITGTLKKVGGGGVMEYEAPLSMASKLSVNSLVEYKAGTAKSEKWQQRKMKITKVLS